MRLVKKRKAICFLAGVALLLLFLILTQNVVLDFRTSFSVVPTADNDYILTHDLSPVPDDLKFADFLSSDNVTRMKLQDVVSPNNVTRLKPRCSPVHNIAFVKTHKAGSSTVANILQRYGLTHNLTFALPNTKFHSAAYNYITKAGDILTSSKVLPPPPGGQYNILFNHAIYNRTAFHMIMPNSTVYISILREPFQQFVSAFEYYHADRVFGHRNPDILNAANPLSEYLASPYKYERNLGHFSYIKNKQAEDLGLHRAEFFFPEKLDQYISSMDKDFSLIMIMEHFDESLLLLKHELCWEMKDILYIPKNKNVYKPQRNFTEEDHLRHRRMSHLDYTLYSHYLHVLIDKLQNQSQDFPQELAHFRSLLAQVKQSCLSGTTFSVAETKWHGPFEVTKQDCSLMLMSELAGLDLLYKVSGWVPVNNPVAAGKPNVVEQKLKGAPS